MEWQQQQHGAAWSDYYSAAQSLHFTGTPSQQYTVGNHLWAEEVEWLVNDQQFTDAHHIFLPVGNTQLVTHGQTPEWLLQPLTLHAQHQTHPALTTVLNVDGLHWITVHIVNAPNGPAVYVFEPLPLGHQLEAAVQETVHNFLGALTSIAGWQFVTEAVDNDSVFFVNGPQRDGWSCGFYAAAAARALLGGQDPASYAGASFHDSRVMLLALTGDRFESDLAGPVVTIGQQFLDALLTKLPEEQRNSKHNVQEFPFADLAEKGHLDNACINRLVRGVTCRPKGSAGKRLAGKFFKLNLQQRRQLPGILYKHQVPPKKARQHRRSLEKAVRDARAKAAAAAAEKAALAKEKAAKKPITKSTKRRATPNTYNYQPSKRVRFTKKTPPPQRPRRRVFKRILGKTSVPDGDAILPWTTRGLLPHKHDTCMLSEFLGGKIYNVQFGHSSLKPRRLEAPPSSNGEPLHSLELIHVSADGNAYYVEAPDNSPHPFTTSPTMQHIWQCGKPVPGIYCRIPLLLTPYLQSLRHPDVALPTAEVRPDPINAKGEKIADGQLSISPHLAAKFRIIQQEEVTYHPWQIRAILRLRRPIGAEFSGLVKGMLVVDPQLRGDTWYIYESCLKLEFAVLPQEELRLDKVDVRETEYSSPKFNSQVYASLQIAARLLGGEWEERLRGLADQTKADCAKSLTTRFTAAAAPVVRRTPLRSVSVNYRKDATTASDADPQHPLRASVTDHHLPVSVTGTRASLVSATGLVKSVINGMYKKPHGRFGSRSGTGYAISDPLGVACPLVAASS